MLLPNVCIAFDKIDPGTVQPVDPWHLASDWFTRMRKFQSRPECSSIWIPSGPLLALADSRFWPICRQLNELPERSPSLIQRQVTVDQNPFEDLTKKKLISILHKMGSVVLLRSKYLNVSCNSGASFESTHVVSFIDPDLHKLVLPHTTLCQCKLLDSNSGHWNLSWHADHHASTTTCSN